MISQCGHGFEQHIRETLALCHSTEHLDRWGLEVEFSESEQHQVEGAHCDQQDWLASRIGQFSIALAGKRWLWGVDFVESWPKRMCLLSPAVCPQKRQAAIEQLRRQPAIIDLAKSSPNRKCAEWASRSPLGLTAAVQVRSILSQSAWSLTNEASKDFETRS